MGQLTVPLGHATSKTTNFYYSFLVLSPPKRRAIRAVYAFARRADDLADDGMKPEAVRAGLERYREALDACYNIRDSNLHDPALRALAVAIQQFTIPRQPFDDLIRGFEMDLAMDGGGRGYRTFDELRGYCYHVAGTIGLICIEIFGYRNAGTREYAAELGTTLQLVNILRDLPADAGRGRVYLPLDDLAQFGVKLGQIASGEYNEAFINLMRFECARAEQCFASTRRLLPDEDRRSMIAAEIMAAIYWRVLKKIRRSQFKVFEQRIGLSRPQRLWTALSVYLGAEWFRPNSEPPA
ncbi:MAG: phytoene/squalene synthase family protein [Terriglobia bacterium]